LRRPVVVDLIRRIVWEPKVSLVFLVPTPQPLLALVRLKTGQVKNNAGHRYDEG